VLDLSSTGVLSPAFGVKKKSTVTVAQVAIPLMFSSIDLPRGHEAKCALPAKKDSEIIDIPQAKSKMPEQIFSRSKIVDETVYPKAKVEEEPVYPRATIVE
jgi:hypothetical protein